MSEQLYVSTSLSTLAHCFMRLHMQNELIGRSAESPCGSSVLTGFITPEICSKINNRTKRIFQLAVDKKRQQESDSK